MLTSNRNQTKRTMVLLPCALLLGACLSNMSLQGAATKARPPIRLESPNAPVLTLTDYGAVGDGVADDGPALQAALKALSAAGGGTLYVPAGQYAILTPIAQDFGGQSSSIIIRGDEPVPVPDEEQTPASGLNLTAEFLIKVGDDAAALTLSNINNLLLKHLTMIGTPDVTNDARVTLAIEEVGDATIDGCEFYGLSSLVAGGAIVASYHSRLAIENSVFLGCTAASGLYTSVVQNIWWRGLRVEHTRFVDYGERQGFFSKTGASAPFSWINLGNAATKEDPSVRRETSITDVFLDEGGYSGISCIPQLYTQPQPSETIDLLLISNLSMNVTNLGFVGIYVDSVQQLMIEDSSFGWSHNALAAVDIHNVVNAVLDNLTCTAGADTIRADDATQKLTIINSVYTTLASAASVTRIFPPLTASVVDPVQYVEQQWLAQGHRNPSPEEWIYWTNQFLFCANDDANCTNQTMTALNSQLSVAPVLMTGDDVIHALALDSVTFVSGPASVTTDDNFSADSRTRIALFAQNIIFATGEDSSIITVQAEDDQHKLYILPVEDVAQVEGQEWLTQINVKLPDELADKGNLILNLKVRDKLSNDAVLSMW